MEPMDKREDQMQNNDLNSSNQSTTTANDNSEMNQNLINNTKQKRGFLSKKIIISTALACVIIIIGIVTTWFLMMNGKYNNASNFYNNKEYGKAIDAFKELKGFKDSNNMMKKSMYDQLIATVTEHAKNGEWQEMKKVIEEKNPSIENTDLLDQLSSTLRDILTNTYTLKEADSKLQDAQEGLKVTQNELESLVNNIKATKKAKDDSHQDYIDAKQKYDNTKDKSVSINIYIIGLVGEENGVQQYEVAPAEYTSYGKMPSSKHAILYTGYTKYTSKGWASLKVVNLGTESVELNDDAGGFTQKWKSYIEKDYYDDKYGNSAYDDMKNAKDKYDKEVNNYNSLVKSKSDLESEVKKFNTIYNDVKSAYDSIKQQCDATGTTLSNKMGDLLGLGLTPSK